MLAAASPAEPVHRRRLVLALVCTAQFMCVLDDTIVNVALPSIRHGLGFSYAELPWVVNGYLVTFGGLLLLAGRATDRFPRRAVFVAGLLSFAAASLGCGLAADPAGLVVARLVQGAGAAAMSAAALAILTATFRGADLARALGAWGGLSGAAGALGMLLGGALTSGPGWRWVFLVNVPIAVAVAVGARYAIAPGRPDRRAPLDAVGAVTVTAGLALLVLTVVRTEQVGWRSPATVAGLVGAAAVLAAFVAVESRHRAPLVPLRVFRGRAVTGGVLCGALLAAAMLALFFFLTLYLQQVLGYGALRAGLAYLPMSLAVVPAATFTGRAVERLGVRPVLAAGFALLTVALAWFGRVDAGGGYRAGVLGPALLGGIGLGVTLVGVVTTITRSLGEEGEPGLASGLATTTQQLGGALGVAALSAVAFARAGAVRATPGAGPDLEAAALTAGFRLAFDVGACLAAAGLVVALLVLPGRRETGAASSARVSVESGPDPTPH